MKFNVSINCENDAFAEDPGQEVTRILRELTDMFEDGLRQEIDLFDVNGNRVGHAGFVGEGG